MGRCQATYGARKKQAYWRISAKHSCYLQEHTEQGNSTNFYHQLNNLFISRKASGLTLLHPTALAGAIRTCARSGGADRAGAAAATGAAIILTVTRRGDRMVTHNAKKYSRI